MKPWKAVSLILIAIAVAASGYGLILMRRGFSALATPSAIEVFAATTARKMAVPSAYRQLHNPATPSMENIRRGMEHFSDHCATCHANDGGGKTPFGKGLYPKPPDLRASETQNKSDGELYYTIQNGVRLSGMPAFSEVHTDTNETWRLILFIRHLPQITTEKLIRDEGTESEASVESSELVKADDETDWSHNRESQYIRNMKRESQYMQNIKSYCVVTTVAFGLIFSVVIPRQKAQAQSANANPANPSGDTTGADRAATNKLPGALILVTKIPAGYRDWRLISVAHEEGNLHSFAAVLGNDVAIKAYREGTLPFPDGAIIASLHYHHVPSAENNKVFGREQSFVPGDPSNVQFMIKDSKKYAATGGWGFGHFQDGKALTDQAKIKSCFDCHSQNTERDLVFARYAR